MPNVHVVTKTRIEKLKTTNRVSGTYVDSVWTDYDDAKRRMQQLTTPPEDRQEYRTYFVGRVETVKHDPFNVTERTAYTAGMGGIAPTRYENDFQVVE